jgi:hypothetical protein
VAFASARGVLQSYPDAVLWYERAATQGHVEAQYQLLLILRKGIAVADGALNRRWYEAAMREASGTSGRIAAQAFPKGLSVARDLRRAFDWGVKAARAGHAGAQVAIARMLLDPGEGMLDYQGARDWLLQAAAHESDAELNLGMMHANGLGVPIDLEAAASFYRRAADRGNRHAKLALGLMHLAGRGTAQDTALAATLFRGAGDIPRAQYNLAMLYKSGNGVEPNLELAEELLENAAKRSYRPALQELVVQKRRAGEIVQAQVWERRLAELGVAEGRTPAPASPAQSEVPVQASAAANSDRQPAGADRTESSSIPEAEPGGEAEPVVLQAHAGGQTNQAAREPAQSSSHGMNAGMARADVETALRKSAEAGDIGAILKLGHFLMGPGRAENSPVEAAEWFRLAALRGSARAQFILGWLHLEGKGIAKDVKQALDWFRRAAENGHTRAQFQLGTIYYFGQGAAPDTAQAVRWYRQAAENGDIEAQYNLALLFLRGECQEANPTDALRWLRSAAEGGSAAALLKMGDLCIRGHQTPKDVVAARAYYARAAARGSSQASARLAGLDESGLAFLP